MCKQFIVYLLNTAELIERRINTANIESALIIAKALYPNHRVVEVKTEMK